MENGHANGGSASQQQQQGTSVTALADTDVYGGGDGPAGYDTSIAPAGDDMDTLEQTMARYNFLWSTGCLPCTRAPGSRTFCVLVSLTRLSTAVACVPDGLLVLAAS